MGEMESCDCGQDGGTGGHRICKFDADSPQDGFFSECQGCSAPMTPPVSMRCQDGDKNGFETDVDCGGPECDKCGPDAACIVATDCGDASDCRDGLCTEPRAGGSSTFSNYDHDAYAYDHAVDWSCAGTTTFDSTGQGSFTTTTACSGVADAQPEVTCGVAQTTAGGPMVCILRAASFVLGTGHTLRLVGDKPVILAIDGDATIEGTIDASASGATPGAGGNASCTVGLGQNGQSDTGIDDGAGGGAGGGFAAGGGKGGVGDRGGPNDQGLGGPASMAESDLTLVPLRGGCKGGDGGDGWNGGVTGDGGAGGGAVQVSARGTLTVVGTITAGGGGGLGGSGDEDGGGGGGSGGAILLEAGDAVSVTGSLRAHGGGGGGGSGTGSDDGADGGDGGAGAASGGLGGDAGGASNGGDGGAGGTATDTDSSNSAGSPGHDGEDQGLDGGGGGGGGGGAGVIIVH